MTTVCYLSESQMALYKQRVEELAKAYEKNRVEHSGKWKATAFVNKDVTFEFMNGKPKSVSFGLTSLGNFFTSRMVKSDIPFLCDPEKFYKIQSFIETGHSVKLDMSYFSDGAFHVNKCKVYVEFDASFEE